jgi:abhydrolase domain-containing protein 12
MYLNLINYPFGVDWTGSGERFGFRTNSLVSVYINTTDSMVLGAWHIFPRSRQLKMAIDSKKVYPFKDAKLVYLYFHGNAGNRATGHRTSFYKVFYF